MATENKNLSHYDKATLPDVTNYRFGIVVSQWNNTITEALFEGAYNTLIDCGVPPKNIIRYNVPGSFELVYGSKKIMRDKIRSLSAVIAIGSVIRGETQHFDFVCSATAHGIKDLNIKYHVPVIFCVLTDDTMQQAIDRSGGKHGNKGVEAAIAAIKMAGLAK